jgi:thioredoxin 1
MKELTTKDFSSAIAKGNVVVDFWAPWCGPCKMLGPVFEEVSKGHTDTTFAKVNVDSYGDVADGLGVRGIPTIIFFKDGKEVMRHVGYADKNSLDTKVKHAFK